MRNEIAAFFRFHLHLTGDDDDGLRKNFTSRQSNQSEVKMEYIRKLSERERGGGGSEGDQMKYIGKIFMRFGINERKKEEVCTT